MKKLTNFLFIAIVAVLLLTACAPNDDHELGAFNITQDSFTFSLTPGSDEFTFNYAVTFSSTPTCAYKIVINLGDDSEPIVGSLSGTHEYIGFSGDYTATCVITLPTTSIFEKSTTITLANNNIRDDVNSIQYALTGGMDNLEGKTWKVGSWTAMRSPAERNNVWWDFKNAAVMNDEFTFVPDLINTYGGFRYDNHGDTHMNESLGNEFPDGTTEGSFVTTHYTPATDATWAVSNRDGKTILTINKGFIAYATSVAELQMTEYEVLSFSTTQIRLANLISNSWCYELVFE